MRPRDISNKVHSLWLSRRSLSGNHPSSANNRSVRVCLYAPVHTRAAYRWTCSKAADSLTVQLSYIMSQYFKIGKIIVLYKKERPDLSNLCFTKFKIWIALLALLITVKICALQLRLLVIVSARCNLMLKLRGISRSSAILRSDSPKSNNRKDNSLWVTPFIPRERPNVKHAIVGYLRLPQPTPAPALMRELH